MTITQETNVGKYKGIDVKVIPKRNTQTVYYIVSKLAHFTFPLILFMIIILQTQELLKLKQRNNTVEMKQNLVQCYL